MNALFKTSMLFLISLISSNLRANHDSTCGVYLNAHDFKAEKISYSPKAGIKFKWKIHDTRKFIEIHIGDSTHILQFDSIYGYRDAAGTVHRMYKNLDYVVLNPSEKIQLYRILQGDGGKGNYEQYAYYFSAEIGEILWPLTKHNLKTAFANASVFHELLDMYFSEDLQLTAYDKFYHMYKINRIYQFSTQIPIITK